MGVMDLREKKSEVNETQKSCSDCKTTKTPLWRGGPAGPKSLCNACGIKFRKKRRAIEDPNRVSEKKKKKKKKKKKSPSQSITTSSSTEDNSAYSHENGLSRSVKMRLFFLGSEVLLHTSSSSSVIVKKQRRKRKLGEEELAAVSLMALSCGAVFA